MLSQLLLLAFAALAASQVPTWTTTNFYDSANCSDVTPYAMSMTFGPTPASCNPVACHSFGTGSSSTICSFPSVQFASYIVINSYKENDCSDVYFSYYFFRDGHCNSRGDLPGSFTVGCSANGSIFYNTYNDSSCTSLTSTKASSTTGGVCTTESIGVPGLSFGYVCPGSVFVWQSLYSSTNCSGPWYEIKYRYVSAPSCTASPCQAVSTSGGSFGSQVTCPSFSSGSRSGTVFAQSFVTNDCTGSIPSFASIDGGRCNLASPRVPTEHRALLAALSLLTRLLTRRA